MAQSIGVVAETAGTVTVVGVDGSEREVSSGDQIFEGEVLSTQGADSQVNITFNNGCQMSLGANETALIDETVYKVEFFEDADVLVDLESAEGISKEVAEQSKESVDDFYLADSEGGIDASELEAIETAAGGGVIESSQVDEAEIEERVDFEPIEPSGTGFVPSGYEGGGASQGIPSQTVERGGELLTPDAPTLSVLNINSGGFLNTIPTISGSAPQGSEVVIYDNNDEIGSITVGESGTFSYTPQNLEDGAHSLTGQVTTPTGTESPMSEAIVFVLDTVAPEEAVVTIADIVNTNSPVITGTAEALSRVDVTIEDQTYSTTSDSDGNWSIALDSVVDGSYDLHIVVTDQAGNASLPILDSIVIDTTAPDMPIVQIPDITNSSDPMISGTAGAGDNVTVTVGEQIYTTQANSEGDWDLVLANLSDGDYEVTVTVTDAAGNVSQGVTTQLTVDLTAPDAPVIENVELNDAIATISGSSEAESSVTVNVEDASFTVVSDAEGHWSVTTSSLEDGNYTVTATVTDSAGNTSGTSAIENFVLDTQAPLEPVIESIDISSSGVVVANGTAEAGSQIEVQIAQDSFLTVAAEDGTWSLTTPALGEGDYMVTVTATDTAGNSSAQASASITIDMTVSYTIDYESHGSEGTVHTIEDTTLLGIKSDAGFDRTSNTLNLDNAQTDYVTSHTKGYGVEGGGRGEDKAIGADEALVIQLDSPVDSIDVSINKLSFFESGRWIAYDENMEKVGEDSFSFVESLFGDDSYDTSLFSNGGALTIDADDVSGDFQYLVFTTSENFQGKISSYFVEDVSYETTDAFTYDMTLSNVPMDDADTTLYISGLDDSVRLEDGEGNSIGSYENGTWSLGEDEINELGTINGELTLQIVSDTALEPGSLTPTCTIMESSLQTYESEVVDSVSPLSDASLVFDFENLEDVTRIDLSEDEINLNNLTLQDVMKLSEGENRLEIVSGEHDAHVLTLNAEDWVVKTDAQGNELSFESDGNAYTVYTSTDTDHAYDLIIDEMITIVLEN